MAFWHKLAAKLGSRASLAEAVEEPTLLIYVMLPEPLQPIDRGTRYEDPLEAELDIAGVGFVSGGGSSLSDELPDGTRTIEFCGIDIDVFNVEAGRELLRLHLPELGCPEGTQLHYCNETEIALLDEFDGKDWRLGLPRTALHPGFGI